MTELAMQPVYTATQHESRTHMTNTTATANLISAAREWISNLDAATLDVLIGETIAAAENPPPTDAELWEAATLSNENMFRAIARHYPTHICSILCGH